MIPAKKQMSPPAMLPVDMVDRIGDLFGSPARSFRQGEAQLIYKKSTVRGGTVKYRIRNKHRTKDFWSIALSLNLWLPTAFASAQK